MFNSIDHLFDVSGKVAIVTGGAKGLGRMIADGLAAAGVHVYITSRKSDAVQEAAAEISKIGECTPIVATLDNPEGLVRLADEFKNRESQLDLLVNNAGKTWGAPLESFPDEAWPSVMAVNVQGPFTLMRELLPLLKKSGSGAAPACVINVGSVAGCRREPISAYSYSASKAALQHLSKLLAAEVASMNVTVNTIVPGYFPTNMTAHIRGSGLESELTSRIPLSRLGSAQDIVGMCIFLASAAGGYITGSSLYLDGGISGCT